MNNIRSTKFTLSITDEEKFEDWYKDHRCQFVDDGTTPVNPAGAIGGSLSYIFTPTGLGMCTSVRCVCGDELDLTDVERW